MIDEIFHFALFDRASQKRPSAKVIFPPGFDILNKSNEIGKHLNKTPGADSNNFFLLLLVRSITAVNFKFHGIHVHWPRVLFQKFYGEFFIRYYRVRFFFSLFLSFSLFRTSDNRTNSISASLSLSRVSGRQKVVQLAR